jgi:hypothetical protein
LLSCAGRENVLLQYLGKNFYYTQTIHRPEAESFRIFLISLVFIDPVTSIILSMQKEVCLLLNG